MSEAKVRKGYFLKKGSSVYNKVKVLEYNFVKLSNTRLATTDNNLSNVIYARYHEEEELSEVIKISKQMESDLLEKHQKIPVVYPRDFTSDWIEQKRKSKRNEEEEDDDETSSIKELEQMLTKEKDDEKNENKLKNIEKIPIATEINHEPLLEEDTVEKLSHLNNPQDVSALTEEIEKPLTNNENIEHVFNNIDDRFEEGYRKGLEEKMNLENDKILKTLQSLDLLTKALGPLKKDVLKSAEENFLEIAQGLCVSLFRKELVLDPEKIKGLLHQFIEQNITESDFKIKVSKETFESLKDLNLENLKDKIFLDQNLTKDEIKIENAQGTFDLNLKTAVEDMIQKADIHLMSEKPKS